MGANSAGVAANVLHRCDPNCLPGQKIPSDQNAQIIRHAGFAASMVLSTIPAPHWRQQAKGFDNADIF